MLSRALSLVRLTDLGFSRAVPSRAEAELLESYSERGAEAPGQRTAPRRLLTRVGQPVFAGMCITWFASFLSELPRRDSICLAMRFQFLAMLHELEDRETG